MNSRYVSETARVELHGARKYAHIERDPPFIQEEVYPFYNLDLSLDLAGEAEESY